MSCQLYFTWISALDVHQNPVQNQTQFKTKPNKAKIATIIMNRDREKSNKEKLKKPHSIRVHAQAIVNSDYMQREKKKNWTQHLEITLICF